MLFRSDLQISSQSSSTSEVSLVDPNLNPPQRPISEEHLEGQNMSQYIQNNDAMGNTFGNISNNVGNSPSNTLQRPRPLNFGDMERNEGMFININNDQIRGNPGQNNINNHPNPPSIYQSNLSLGPLPCSDQQIFSTPEENNFQSNEIGGNPRKNFSSNIPARKRQQQQINFQQQSIDPQRGISSFSLFGKSY